MSLNFQRGVHDAEIKHGFYAKSQTCIETTDIEGLLEGMKNDIPPEIHMDYFHCRTWNTNGSKLARRVHTPI